MGMTRRVHHPQVARDRVGAPLPTEAVRCRYCPGWSHTVAGGDLPRLTRRAYDEHWARVHASPKLRVRLRWRRLGVLAHLFGIIVGVSTALAVAVVELLRLPSSWRIIIAFGSGFSTYYLSLVLLAIQREPHPGTRRAFE